jgi:hypothetical protein
VQFEYCMLPVVYLTFPKLTGLKKAEAGSDMIMAKKKKKPVVLKEDCEEEEEEEEEWCGATVGEFREMHPTWVVMRNCLKQLHLSSRRMVQ